MTPGPDSTRPAPPADWSAAKPDVIPRPTYMPAAMAFGITLLLWGIVTSPVLLGVGAAVMALSLAGWIGEMRHE